MRNEDDDARTVAAVSQIDLVARLDVALDEARQLERYLPFCLLVCFRPSSGRRRGR
jgi:hypothetical protein